MTCPYAAVRQHPRPCQEHTLGSHLPWPQAHHLCGSPQPRFSLAFHLYFTTPQRALSLQPHPRLPLLPSCFYLPRLSLYCSSTFLPEDPDEGSTPHLRSTPAPTSSTQSWLCQLTDFTIHSFLLYIICVFQPAVIPFRARTVSSFLFFFSSLTERMPVLNTQSSINSCKQLALEFISLVPEYASIF